MAGQLTIANPFLSMPGMSGGPDLGSIFGDMDAQLAGNQRQQAGLLMGVAAAPMPAAPQWQAPTARAYFNPATNQLRVGGQDIAADDAEATLRLADQPNSAPTGEGWQALSDQDFGALAQSIRNPSMGRLFSKNFDMGVAGLKELYGAGLSFAGAEGAGQSLIESAGETQRRLSPFQRNATDMYSSPERGLTDWFVANVAQFGPSFLESVSAGILGAGVGMAVGGPAASVGGTIAGVFGRPAFKAAVIKAARKEMAGETLDQAEKQLLKDAAAVSVATLGSGRGAVPLATMNRQALTKGIVAAGRTQAATGGAVVASAANSYRTGVSDVYAQQIDQGTEDRGVAAAAGVPYALLELVPEGVAALKIMGYLGRGSQQAGRAGLKTYAGRAARGFGAGALLEGGTEAGQEALVMGGAGEDIMSDEGVLRLVNAFAAGAAVGGPIGGVANLRGTDAVDALTMNKLGYEAAPRRDVDPAAGQELPPGAQFNVPNYQAPMGPTPSVPGATPLPTLQQQAEQMGSPGASNPGMLGANYQPAAAPVAPTPPAPVAPAPAAAAPAAAPVVAPTPAPAPVAAAGAALKRGAQAAAAPGKEKLTARPTSLGPGAVIATPTAPVVEAPAVREQVSAPPAPASPAQSPEQLVTGAFNEMATAPSANNTDQFYNGLGGQQRGAMFALPLPNGDTVVVPSRETVVNWARSFASTMGGELRQAEIDPFYTYPGQGDLTSTLPGQIVMVRPAVVKADGTVVKGVLFGEPAPAQVAPAPAAQVDDAAAQMTWDRATEQSVPLWEALRQQLGSGRIPPWAELTEEQQDEFTGTLAEILARPGGELNRETAGEVRAKVTEIAKARAPAPAAKVQPKPAAPAAAPAAPGKAKLTAKPAAKEAAAEPQPPKNPAPAAAPKVAPSKASDRVAEPYKDVAASVQWYSGGNKWTAAGLETPGWVPPLARLYESIDIDGNALGGKADVRQGTFTNSDGTQGSYVTVSVRSVDEKFGNRGNTAAATIYFRDAALAGDRAVVEQVAEELARWVAKPENKKTAQGGLNTGADAAIRFVTDRTGSAKPTSTKVAPSKTSDRVATAREQWALAMPERIDLDFDDVMSETQERWVKFVAANDGSVTTEQAETWLSANEEDVVGPEPAERSAEGDVEDLLIDADVAKTRKDFEQLVPELVATAFFNTDANIRKAVSRLQDYLRSLLNVEGDAWKVDLISRAIIQEISTNARTARSGTAVAPWWQWLKDTNSDKGIKVLSLPRGLNEGERANFTKVQKLDDSDVRSQGGRFSVADGKVAEALPAGRLRLALSRFLAGLKVSPKVMVYRNVLDLQQRNPELYREAVAARPEGDFNSTPAAGYSFGPNVIIFSDNIMSADHLNAVLAHETIGHFGLRSLLSPAQLREALERVYRGDARVRAMVDNAVETTGVDRLEAIEEVLADMAAVIDTSLLRRVWNAVKTALNKLGAKFGDEHARYLIGLSRRYVRNGSVGHMVSGDHMVRTFEQMRAEAQGMFSRAQPVGDLASMAFNAGGLNYASSRQKGLRGAAEMLGNIKSRGVDIKYTVARALETVQTFDQKARRSDGLSRVFNLIEKQASFASTLLNKYQNMTETLHPDATDIFKTGTLPNDVQREDAGRMLAHAALHRQRTVTDRQMMETGKLLVTTPSGQVEIDQTVLDRLKELGKVTAADFQAGFDIEATVPGVDGRPETVQRTRFQYDVDENSLEWKVYTESRAAIEEAAVDNLRAEVQSYNTDMANILDRLNRGRSGANLFTMRDRERFWSVLDTYRKIRDRNAKRSGGIVSYDAKAMADAERFLVSWGRALFTTGVFEVWTSDPAAGPQFIKDHEQYQDAQFDRARAALVELRQRVVDKDTSLTMQNRIRDLAMNQDMLASGEFATKRTIATAYVPFSRRGDWRVRLVAESASGDVVKLHQSFRDLLPYYHVANTSEAIDMARQLDETFDGQEFEVLTESGGRMTVTLRAEYESNPRSPGLETSVNFREFIYALQKMDVNITPEMREQIIKTMTDLDDRARKSLQRTGVPGWDKDVVRSASEYLETTAHVAAKKMYRGQIDDILLNSKFWLGDADLLERLAEAVESATTPGSRAEAQRAYEEYAYKYLYMAPGGRTVKIGGKDVKTLGRGEDYKEYGKEVLRWYSENTNIQNSVEDHLSGETGSKLKMLAVMLQLGGSIASAAVNLSSIPTNTLPFLAYRNEAKGFGGGYGMGNATSAVWKAGVDIGHPRFQDQKFLQQMMADGTWGDYGLTRAEGSYLYEATLNNRLGAAQMNALIGTSRGKVQSPRVQAAIKAWMSMFSYTEQYNRRVTALAAYRLELQRLVASSDDLMAPGLSTTDRDSIMRRLEKKAGKAADEAVIASQGEYGMFNRPAMARGNLLQYIFMYKQFVITTIQLMKNMPAKGRLFTLAMLLFASGLKGIPFADDIMDLIDTLLQKFGFKIGSVEKELAEIVDAAAPGLTPVVMRGVLDQFTGATISTRLGFGDVIPLTGFFRAGADPARELMDFAGPVVGGLSQLVGTAAQTTQYSAEVLGLAPDRISLVDIIRNSPVAAARALGDAYTFMDTGKVLNNRNQVVMNDVGAATIFARALGFYPAQATRVNDVIRMSKYATEYQREITAGFTAAYLKAVVSGDDDLRQDVVDAVAQWNDAAEGTGLELRNFGRTAARAAREAQRPAAARYLRTTPVGMRPETMELLRAYGLEDEVTP